MHIISQGAEAIITQQDDCVYKKRIPKTYRLQQIDTSIRKSRTKREAKVLHKANELGINVPQLFENQDEYTLVMQYIKGERLRDTLLTNPLTGSYLKQVGVWLATLHDAGIIHGDLTTSNVLVDENNTLYLIDFGLSFFSKKPEDKAVDIHLLKQALESTHYQHTSEFFKQFLLGYAQSSESEVVLHRLKTVQKRGRNKH